MGVLHASIVIGGGGAVILGVQNIEVEGLRVNNMGQKVGWVHNNMIHEWLMSDQRGLKDCTTYRTII